MAYWVSSVEDFSTIRIDLAVPGRDQMLRVGAH
jgi:hypothetical protein